MKRKALGIISFIFLLLIGCNARVVQANTNSYQITNQNYDKDSISIVYPNIVFQNENSKQNQINTILKDMALSECNVNGESIKNMTLEINYKIMWSNINLLNVKYSGDVYTEDAAYPRDLNYSTNIDIANGKRLMLKDYIIIDNSLIKKIRAYSFQKDDELGYGAFQYILRAYNDTGLLKILNSSDSPYEETPVVYSYLSDDSLGLIFAVPHEAGDQVEIKLKYEDIKDNINRQGILCNEISSVNK